MTDPLLTLPEISERTRTPIKTLHLYRSQNGSGARIGDSG